MMDALIFTAIISVLIIAILWAYSKLIFLQIELNNLMNKNMKQEEMMKAMSATPTKPQAQEPTTTKLDGIKLGFKEVLTVLSALRKLDDELVDNRALESIKDVLTTKGYLVECYEGQKFTLERTDVEPPTGGLEGIKRDQPMYIDQVIKPALVYQDGTSRLIISPSLVTVKNKKQSKTTNKQSK